MELPVGIRFVPSDIEIIEYYLTRKVKQIPIVPGTITDFDIYSRDPDNLPGNFIHGHDGNQEFFFSCRHRNSAKGNRVKRIVADIDGRYIGRWLGNREVDIYSNNLLVGKTASFNFMRSSDGKIGKEVRSSDDKTGKEVRTDWIMHEYLLPGDYFQNYAVYKIYNKSVNRKRKAREAPANTRHCYGRTLPILEGKDRSILYEDDLRTSYNNHPAAQPHQDPSLPSSFSMHSFNNLISTLNEQDLSKILMPYSSYSPYYAAAQASQHTSLMPPSSLRDYSEGDYVNSTYNDLEIQHMTSIPELVNDTNVLRFFPEPAQVGLSFNQVLSSSTSNHVNSISSSQRDATATEYDYYDNDISPSQRDTTLTEDDYRNNDFSSSQQDVAATTENNLYRQVQPSSTSNYDNDLFPTQGDIAATKEVDFYGHIFGYVDDPHCHMMNDVYKQQSGNIDIHPD